LKFTKLRLSGFKSFVDPAELEIERGITGIVGPNGCGKSNLVEALRWVMGETSAKRMRGAEMDDVIFGGTANRPPRNLAEVTLLVDNSGRTAPAGFNQSDELEVCRRIERGRGSDYRINGKPVRARDVQILFQDNGSGANSAALVSQGRVGALINARPGERRLLLEEAAGITGLHSRRHEAELRLRAAEENLTRLQDVVGAMETQLSGLQRQARQAARYRNLSERIRRTEAVVLHLRWIATEAALADARRRYAENEEQVREHMLAVTRATTEQTQAAAVLPQLRRSETEAAAALQRLVLAREGLDAEERRVRDAQAEAERRLQQIQRDLEREHGLSADAADALRRLEEERAVLAAAQDGEAEAEAAAETALVEAETAIEALENELAELTETVAAGEAQRQALLRRAGELESRLAALSRRTAEARQQKEALEQEIAAEPDFAEAEMEVAAAETALEAARAAAEAAETRRPALEAAVAAARQAVQTAEAELAGLKAESDALNRVLRVSRQDGFPPLLDEVRVAKGYETAFGAALGDDVEAAVDPAAPVHWRPLPPVDAAPLPEGAEPLAARVDAPEVLARRLAHIGVVADSATGAALAPGLRPGQQLVSMDGGQWRWDGLVSAAGAPTAAAARLQQRNRLAELQGEIEAAAAAAAIAAERLEAASEAAAEGEQRERAARQTVQDAFARLTQARERQGRLAQAAAARQSRLAGLTESLERAETDQEEAAVELAETLAAIEALPDTAAQREKQAALRSTLAERRSAHAAARNALDGLRREAAARRQRLAAIEQEVASWHERAAGTRDRLAELDARTEETKELLAELAERPAEIAAQREALFDRIAAAEATRKEAADLLATGEARLASAEQALKAAETGLAEARENRVRGEAEVRAAMTALEGIRERITERLSCSPEELAAIAELDPEAPLPDAREVEERLERLMRERDGMGPVNLRAEIEAEELETQIRTMHAERDDLIAAIERLRQGIASLNREARERLLAAFEVVDGHFRRLFVRLFGGGKAELKLTDTDDPLNAGLEIFASPPGKRLQHLSLLSGGEQALTAVSLLFGVFLTNPAPICVLDEVDAPLDDANVDRFCTMLEELARDEVTRFLVITHHRMTMARADRLFGVTMLERGVSQLVSVDLERAEALRQTSFTLV